MTHDYAYKYEEIKAFAEKFLADGGLLSAVENYIIVPGLCDVHVHFREPGFSYKETIASGSAAAAHGGYTAVCTMPNLSPVPDCAEHLKAQLDAIDKSAVIEVIPYGAITVGEKGEELSDMESMADNVCAFSDDGRGVQNDGMMREAMAKAKRLGKIIAAHCEDNSLLFGGYIHDGEYAKAHGHRGISSESEYRQIERDLRLAEETGCAYHVCHISTKESVELIRQAKARGVDVTSETAPHYLVLCDEDMQGAGRFKMNPPIRSAADRDALLEGLLDGTIDILATDHAPHSAEEKARGLEKSLMGVVGLECAFPVLYTGLALTGRAPLATMLRAMTDTPRARFGLPTAGIEPGAGDFAIFDLDKTFTIDPDTFLSKGHATPFAGWRVRGKCMETYVGGNCVWRQR